MSVNLYPGLPLLLGVALMPLLGVAGRRLLSLLAPALALLLLAAADPAELFA